MTNRAFKDFRKNKPIIDAANDTVNVMCILLLTVHKLFPKVMTKKAICTFIDDRVEYCEISNGYEKDGIFDYKMERVCDDLGVSFIDCGKIVSKYMRPINSNVRNVFINNVALMFVQLSQLIAAMLSDQAETERPIERVQEMGGNIEVTTVSGVDYRKYRIKPDKVTFTEQRKARQELQWLKAYQDHVNKEGG